MNILVVGSGGREHAIIWKLAQSSRVSRLYCAPGNGGISELAECIPVSVNNIEGIVEASKQIKADMVVVAPDNPLADGMVNALEDAGIRAFGPRREAALIEASKAFSKNLMKKYYIPTAEYMVFDDSRQAKLYLKDVEYPVVVKADGLALGKGVIICNNPDEAGEAVSNIMEKKQFGDSGSKVVIEEFLEGREVSILAFTDGKTIIPMLSSQDHKRALDGDKGLNTGGMGTFSPSPFYTPDIEKACIEKIFLPTVNALNNEGRTFKGVLYFGLILTEKGPKVLEYNARFGDPETQVLLPLLKNDLVDVFDAVIDGRLHDIKIEWKDEACVCVIMASGGYPGEYRKGFRITGMDEALKDTNVVIFHAGTRRTDGQYYTDGGRVIGVTACGVNIDKARERAYEAVSKINFEGAHYRRDIGLNLHRS
ncbi:MAG TPA: phosphoribosylamine--glycine ligase [Ruminiclostridium sp.]|jgi:phosphoribosylamine--glycine ligase|nr:phosphoribosylamine--glycine ligase [Clostridiaceae bacterium]HAA24985.1 phosphoribosylamine--glycine ligase [Ruminiclostridium sp.]